MRLTTLPLGLLLGACSASAPPAPKPAAPKPAAPPSEAPAPVASPPAASPPTDTTWVEAAVLEALEWEVMPGTTGEPDDGTRAAALKAFFLAHPEYASAEKRAALAAEACGLDGTEAAHEWLVNPPPKEPLVVEVTGDDWKVFVGHASHNCTSDDWSYYTNEASEAASQRGAVTTYGSARNDVLVIQRGGVELKRVPLTGQGYLAVRAGAEPQDLDYSPDFVEPLDRYFGAPAGN